MPTSITLPSVVVERVRKEAEKLGVSLEEYLLELVSGNLGPRDRAKEYASASLELLEQARKELKEGNLRQAAEKVWGAAALAIKAYACAKEGRKLTSHGELWEYKDVVANDLGEWVRDAWAHASSMHTCFYEGWCTGKDVEAGMGHVEKLVKEIREKVAR